MGTTIGGGNSKFKSVRRLQKWNQIANDERSDYEVFKKIDDILKKTQINTKIINDAKLYYKMLSEKNEENANIFLTRGKNRNSLIVACSPQTGQLTSFLNLKLLNSVFSAS